MFFIKSYNRKENKFSDTSFFVKQQLCGICITYLRNFSHYRNIPEAGEMCVFSAYTANVRHIIASTWRSLSS